MTQLNKYFNVSSSRFDNTSTKFSVKKLLTISLAIASFSIVGCSEAQQEEATQTLGLDEKDVFSLKLGTCFNDPKPSAVTEGEDSDMITDVPIRECNKPHDNEVFHIFNLPEAPLPPASEELDELVYAECSKAYGEFMGKSFDDSKYNMNYLSPSNETWADKDREVVCYIFNPEEQQMTASMKGAAL